MNRVETDRRAWAALAVPLVACALAGACGGGADDDASASGGAQAGGPEGAAVAQDDGSAAGFEDVPTMDELEAQMAEEVTETNADAEFERLQAELEADLAAEEDG
jgi:hypothetical protein